MDEQLYKEWQRWLLDNLGDVADAALPEGGDDLARPLTLVQLGKLERGLARQLAAAGAVPPSRK